MSEEVRRYDKYFQDGPGLLEQDNGMFVLYSEYEKLLAKYNGVFEWFARQPFVSDAGRSNFQELAELFKKRYEAE